LVFSSLSSIFANRKPKYTENLNYTIHEFTETDSPPPQDRGDYRRCLRRPGVWCSRLAQYLIRPGQVLKICHRHAAGEAADEGVDRQYPYRLLLG